MHGPIIRASHAVPLTIALFLAALVPARPATATADPGSVTGVDLTIPVGHAVSGMVRDEDGHDATPTIAACVPGTDRCRFGNATSYGSFLVAGLRDGEYVLRIDPSYQEDVAGGWYGPSGYAASEADATRVRIAGGDVEGIRIVLPRGAYSISGSVTVADPVRQSERSAVSAAACPDDAPQECVVLTDVHDGAYTIGPLRPGTYRVLVWHQTTTDLPAGWIGPNRTMVFSRASAMPVVLSPARRTVSGVDVGLVSGSTIRGQIFDARGRPLDTAVYACPPGAEYNDFLCVSGRTQPDGRFVLHGVMPGVRYEVTYQGGDTGDVVGGSGRWGFAPWSVRDFSVIVGKDGLELPPLRAPTPALSVSGTLRGTLGQGLADAELLVCGRSVPSSGPWELCSPGWTDANGRYSVRLLMAGYYWICVDLWGLLSGCRAADGSLAADRVQGAPVQVGTPIVPRITGRSPGVNASRVARTSAVTVRLSVAVSGVNAGSFVLRDDETHRTVPATVSYDPKTRTGTLRPRTSLVPGRRYAATVDGIWSSTYNPLPPTTWSFTVAN